MSEVPLYLVVRDVRAREGRVHHVNEVPNNYFTEICSGSEAGSYLRLIDFCITQL